MTVPAFDPREAAIESRQVGTLTPAMRGLVETYVERCAALGVQILVYCTYRNERMQAMRYRTNRPLHIIRAKANDLRQRGFPQLADLLLAVGPQADTPEKRILTNAGPGESYHQHGEAIDRVPLIHGQPLWNPGELAGGIHPAWLTCESVAKIVGLDRISWERVHLQRRGLSILKLMDARYRAGR